MVITSVFYYTFGAVKYDCFILWNVFKVVFTELKAIARKSGADGKCSVPIFRARIVLLFHLFIANLFLCIYFATHNADYASNYILMLFMLNTFMYCMYYVIMKFYCGERPSWTCIMYFLLMHLCAVPSLYFFVSSERNSELSPAESRHLNQSCSLFDFYDFHDIWHFLGGFGVFFTFMFLLTIDEDLKYKRRDGIYVF